MAQYCKHVRRDDPQPELAPRDPPARELSGAGSGAEPDTREPLGLAGGLTVQTFLPACAALFVKLGAVSLQFALTETWLAKLRLFQMMDLLGFSFVLSITALLFVATGI